MEDTKMIIQEEKKTESEFMIDIVTKEAHILSLVWPTIRPHVDALSKQYLLNGDSRTAYFQPDALFYRLLEDKSFQLLMGYKVESKEKFLKGEINDRTFVGFCMLEYRSTGVHNYLSFILPEYRGTNMLKLGNDYVEDMAKKVPATILTAAVDESMVPMLEKLGYTKGLVEMRKYIKNT